MSYQQPTAFDFQQAGKTVLDAQNRGHPLLEVMWRGRPHLEQDLSQQSSGGPLTRQRCFQLLIRDEPLLEQQHSYPRDDRPFSLRGGAEGVLSHSSSTESIYHA